jgi:hypothetical protein
MPVDRFAIGETGCDCSCAAVSLWPCIYSSTCWIPANDLTVVIDEGGTLYTETFTAGGGCNAATWQWTATTVYLEMSIVSGVLQCYDYINNVYLTLQPGYTCDPLNLVWTGGYYTSVTVSYPSKTCGVACSSCAPAGMPAEFSVTDSNGSYTAAWDPQTCVWNTAYLCSSSKTPVANCTGGTAVCAGTPNNAGVLYYYVLGCIGANTMSIQRIWGAVDLGSPCTVFPQYVPCSCATPAMVIQQATASATITCGSIAWSGTLTPAGTLLPDPVGGTTSFSQ